VKTLAAIVEGYGDQQAVPTLISRLAHYLGHPAIAPNPIRVGEWKKLRRPGELERVLTLANSRNPDGIIIVQDLEDGKPIDELNQHKGRIDSWINGRSIQVDLVFLVKEYENIFLSCAETFNSDEEKIASAIAGHCSTRDAKGALRALLGRRYKETQDQLAFTKMIHVGKLLERNRSARKLARAITGLKYEEICQFLD
jgi:hypothetical protein